MRSFEGISQQVRSEVWHSPDTKITSFSGFSKPSLSSMGKTWTAFSNLVLPSGNSTPTTPPHQRSPGSREECYCGFSLQEASIMMLFMALTEEKKLSLSLWMSYNHGEGNSYFGALSMPGTLQPLSCLIFSMCYKNANLNLYVVDRNHPKEIKKMSSYKFWSGFETRTNLCQYMWSFHDAKDSSIEFGHTKVFMWLYKTISVFLGNDNVSIGMRVWLCCYSWVTELYELD